MSKKNAEDFLIAGGENEDIRTRYDAVKSMEEFVALANEEGYVFNATDLKTVLEESGDSFDSLGPPRNE